MSPWGDRMTSRNLGRRFDVLGTGVLRGLFAISLATFTGNSALAQDVPPLPSPTVHFGLPGAVTAMLQLPDGSMIIGGEFEDVDGIPRSGLAKLGPNGLLDATWAPLLDAYPGEPFVDVIAYEPSTGYLYLGGNFLTVNGLTKHSLVKISATSPGVVDPDWDPLNYYPNALPAAIGAYGGDLYFSFQGSPIQKASTSGTGALDTSWNGGLPYVESIAIDPDGQLFAGGPSLVKILTSGTGGVDPTWNPTFDCFGGNCFSQGDQLLLDGAGELYFTSVSGLYRVPTGGSGIVDQSWIPSLVFPTAIALSSNGYVFAQAANAGSFFSGAGVFRVTTSTPATTDPSWVPIFAYGPASVLLPDQAGGVYVGGTFASIDGQVESSFAEIYADGGVSATTPSLENPAVIRVLASLADNTLIVGGAFTRADQFVRFGLAKLLPDGTVDSEWNPLPASSGLLGEVSALVVDGMGSAYVGGGLLPIQGSAATSNLIKVSTTGSGSEDASWNPAPDAPVNAISIGLEGQLYVGGRFDSIGGLTRSRVAKLDPDTGAVDPTWNPGLPGASVVTALAADSAGNVYIAGGFLLRAAADGAGAVDSSWTPTTNGNISDVVLDNTGFAYITGGFSTIDGQPRMSVAKISTSAPGNLDAWDALIGTNDCDTAGCIVDSVLLQAGNVYLGGRFDDVAGTSRSDLASVSSTDGSLNMAWYPTIAGLGDLGTGIAIGEVFVLAPSGVNMLAGGNFGAVSGQLRLGLAALPTEPPPDEIFKDGFDGS